MPNTVRSFSTITPITHNCMARQVQKDPGTGLRHTAVQSVQFSRSVMSTAAHQASLSITNSQSSLKLTSIESVIPSSHLILLVPFSSCPQSLPASESFPMSQLFT